VNGVALSVIAMTALWPPWPFGRGDRERPPEETGTIEDLYHETVEVDTSGAIVGSQAKAMESYRLFLDLASEDPILQAEAMRRLADLQLEATEIEQLQNNLQALGGEFGGTVSLYEQLLEAYPGYEKNDLVLYQLARAYEINGQLEEALETLDLLVSEYPETPHLDEANFRRGETLFIQKRYSEADEAYGRVLLTGSSSQFYDQSLYKHGWALFKQAHHEDSAESFYTLLDRRFIPDTAASEMDPAELYASMSRAEQELIADTFRVLSISYSYLDGPASITEHFEEAGQRPYAFIVYTNLGDLYLDQERFQDAADAYQAFVDLDPYHAKAPLLQVEVIEAFKRGGFAGFVLDGKQGFVERYGPGSPYWDTYSYQEQPEVVAHLKTNLTDLAAYHHAEAQTNNDPAQYGLAARWYRNYLQSFPDDQNADQTHFLLSEVLYESGNYRDAAVEYESTAYGYPFHEQSAEAGYAALLAYAEHEKSLDGEELGVWHRQGLESALRFADSYPDHEQALPVLTDAAEKLFALNEFSRARDVGRRVVTRQPAAPPALQRTAWTVVAHSEFDQGNFAEAETAYVRLQSFIPAEEAVERGEITERIASSIYKQGEQAKANGDGTAAVEHFLRVGRVVPTSEIVSTARYDAAATLIQSEDWSRASTVLEDFRRDYPDHELSADITAKLAVAYVESGNNARAASEFERIAGGDGSAEVKQEALWRAAELYANTGQSPAAATAYARYVETYPSPVPQAVEARQKLVVLAEQQGDYPARMAWLDAIVQADMSAGAERTDRTRYLAARAALELAAPTRDAYRAVRLAIPLQESLQLKRERMESALAAYGKAADYGVAEVTTAATYEIAELYHNLSEALFESERPADLSAAELGQYDILLEEQAYPFEEEAIELHEVNVARTADGIYDEYVKRSLDQLASLVPIRYAKDEIGEQFVASIR